MNRERRNINAIEIKDIIGRWDAETNDVIERIYIRESGNFEIVQKTSLLVCEINLNQQSGDDLPILEILNMRGNNTHFNDDSWTIWRYSGDEMDIDFTEDMRLTFKKRIQYDN